MIEPRQDTGGLNLESVGRPHLQMRMNCVVDTVTAEQELDVPLSCLITATVIVLWSIASVGYTLRNADRGKKNKRQCQHIVGWDSLGRVTAALSRIDG